MLLLGTAHQATGDLRYLRAAHRGMDYLMGTNAMRLSYVTGYGEYAESDLHDRLAWGASPGRPTPGMALRRAQQPGHQRPGDAEGAPGREVLRGAGDGSRGVVLQGEHRELERAAGVGGDVSGPDGAAAGRPGRPGRPLTPPGPVPPVGAAPARRGTRPVHGGTGRAHSPPARGPGRQGRGRGGRPHGRASPGPRRLRDSPLAGAARRSAGCSAGRGWSAPCGPVGCAPTLRAGVLKRRTGWGGAGGGGS
ncbi:glycoside hydrolase family 9 protein [Streptomyces zhihengii]